jgi:iron complex transport system ATP-binding protein
MSVFATDRATYGYDGSAHPAIAEVSITIEANSFCAIIGPNGSGKSTLLKLLLGVLRPTEGSASYHGRASADWDRRELARQVGVVPQLEEMLFPFTVRELVGMGRYPHLGPWQREGTADRAAIAQAMRRCDVVEFAGRTILSLSGGERQRVRVARALAQEPHTLVLDEPTAALDIGHEMALFELLAGLREGDGATVVAATHNVNLAARYATQVILLAGGNAVAAGTPEQVLSAERIAAVYQWPVRVLPHPGPGVDQGVPQVIALSQREPRPTDSAPENL